MRDYDELVAHAGALWHVQLGLTPGARRGIQGDLGRDTKP
jgi:hypothetical protein